MANTKQALKRSRQAEKHRVGNKWQMSRMNSFIKRVLVAIEGKDIAHAQSEYRAASSLIDRMANKGLIHKNKAARHKSRLNKRVKALALA